MTDRETLVLDEVRLKIHRFVKLEQMERLRDLTNRLADEVEFLREHADQLFGKYVESCDEIDRLREALDKLARLGNEPEFGNSIGNDIARAALEGKEPTDD